MFVIKAQQRNLFFQNEFLDQTKNIHVMKKAHRRVYLSQQQAQQIADELIREISQDGLDTTLKYWVEEIE